MSVRAASPIQPGRSTAARVVLALWNGLAFLQRALLVISASFITLLVFSEVILRYILQLPLMEVEEIATLVAFWMYFIGASYGTYERSHISAEIIHVFVKNPQHMAAVRFVRSAMSLALAAILTYWAYTYFAWGIERRELSRVLLLPMVYSQSSMFFGSALMTFYFLVQTIDEARLFLRGRTAGTGATASPGTAH